MNATEALGWALVHSLWQLGLAAMALACLLAIVPTRAARTRYALAVTALGLMLALPVGTALRLYGGAPWVAENSSVGSIVAVLQTAPETGAVAARVRVALEPALPWVVVLWFGGVLALSLRLASGWVTAQRLEMVGTHPVPHACTEALARLGARLRITRPVRVLESAVVQVPAVIGWLQPVILLPASALTGLTPLQLEALLAHELAHVRRYDYLVNLLQTVIETLLFYHPAVWWVSRCVREEREHCCDDLAVAMCGDPHVYARALFSLEQLRVTAPAFALAAGGGSLMGRIRRLVAPAPTETFPRWIAGLAAVTLAIGGAAGLVGAGPAPQTSSDRPSFDFTADAPAPQELLGEPPSPAATDSLITRLPDDADARRAAVKGLGRRNDPLALATLVASVWDDPEEDVQREAVESLGKLPQRAGHAALVEVTRTHPNPNVRREAVETIAEVLTSDVALELLAETARGDGDGAVQRKAVKALGKLRDARADALLEEIALDGADAHVQREAVKALGRLRGRWALERVAHLARAHPGADVRRVALERYAEAAAPESALALLTARLAEDQSLAVQREALDELAELPAGVGIPAVIETARSHPNHELRAEASRRLRKSDDPRARDFVEGALRHP